MANRLPSRHPYLGVFALTLSVGALISKPWTWTPFSTYDILVISTVIVAIAGAAAALPFAGVKLGQWILRTAVGDDTTGRA